MQQSDIFIQSLKPISMALNQTITPTVELKMPMQATQKRLREKDASLEALIRDCIRQDRLAQARMYQQYYNFVFSICMRYAVDRDEAKTMVNSAFLKVFKSLESCKKVESFKSWLGRITINACIDDLRKRTKYSQRITELGPQHDKAVDEEIISKLAAEDLLKLIQKVSAASRTVFSLFVIDGYKHKEIADMLKISEGTSRWHLSNAKKELKEFFQKVS